jgi:hypothetical protein
MIDELNNLYTMKITNKTSILKFIINFLFEIFIKCEKKNVLNCFNYIKWKLFL